jgi:hypothetical protein
MAIINDNPDIETDICHTPLEARRREEMKIRRISFGFFRVPGGPVKPETCDNCQIELGSNRYRLNGQRLCRSCFLK